MTDDGGDDRERPHDRPTDRASETMAERGMEATVPASIEVAPSPSAGTQIGRYVVRGVVGSGGMGVVVAAHDPELGRLVAIKLVAGDHGHARTRLVREAQAMARLSHPNVVTVHEVIRHGEQVGIVMELVDGENLATWRAARSRTWSEILAAYVQAARGLAAAHRAGLVHRDFNPSNALIDRDGVVRVTDFGLVRTTGEADPDLPPVDPGARGALDVALTRTGATIGTPAYMAPEQHRGAKVDERTDQWALACSLYAALYGQRPFAGASQREIAAAVLADAIRPEPADTRVPRAVRAAIRRALSHDPADRFATIEGLVAALVRTRRIWLFVAAGAVILAGALAAVMVAGGDRRATCTGLDAPLARVWNPTRAGALRERFARVERDGSAAAHVAGALDRYGEGWLAARTAACTEARRGDSSPDLLDRRMRCLDRRLVEMGVVVTALVGGERDVIRRAGEAVDRLHLVSDCDDPRDTVPRPADPQARAQIAAAEDAIARGWAFHGLGQYERALPLAQQATAVGETSGWAPLLARALLLRGECEDRKRDSAAALATFDRAATVAAQARDDAAVAEALAHHFLVLGEHVGRPAEALAGRRFIEVALERAGQPPRLRAEWLHFLAIMLLSQMKVDDALAAELEAVATWRRLLPAGHTYLVDSLETLGNIHIFLRQFDRAEALLSEVLAARIAATGPHHLGVAEALVNLGELEAQRGRMLGALRYWERSASTARAAGEDYFLSALNLGFARLHLGRWRAAAGDLASALAIAERDAAAASTWVGWAASTLGAALMALGELERAGPLLERAIAAERESGSVYVAQTLAHASRLALLRGDRAAARTHLTEAKAVASAGDPLIALAEAEISRAATGCGGALAAYRRALTAAGQVSPLVTSEATAGLAECLLELGRPADAQAALDPHVTWLEEVGAEAGARARADFALARALVATGGDRARARSLAASARSGFATLGPPGERRAAEVGRWLARPR